MMMFLLLFTINFVMLCFRVSPPPKMPFPFFSFFSSFLLIPFLSFLLFIFPSLFRLIQDIMKLSLHLFLQKCEKRITSETTIAALTLNFFASLLSLRITNWPVRSPAPQFAREQ